MGEVYLIYVANVDSAQFHALWSFKSDNYIFRHILHFVGFSN